VENSRVLVIADAPDSGANHEARYLQHLLADEFDITVQDCTTTFDEAAWDLIYPMEFGVLPEDRITTPWKYVTALRSHVSWESMPAPEIARYLRQHFQRTHVVSARLHREIAPWLPDVAYATPGIDTIVFAKVSREVRANKRLQVGWLGGPHSSAGEFEQFSKPLGALAEVELIVCDLHDATAAPQERAQWYAHADVVVCASPSEGSSRALLEAAATGCALVTTDTGTVPEYLVDGVSACIVPRERNALAHAVTALCADPDWRLHMGHAASAAVHGAWSWQNRAEDYRVFFREALAGREKAQRRMATSTPAGQRWMANTVERAQACMERGQLNEALALLDSLLNVDPGNDGLRDVHAQLLMMYEGR
jgi:hypothetical protein